jgi:alpha-beta hydrolase superfamily lysophospholipase
MTPPNGHTDSVDIDIDTNAYIREDHLQTAEDGTPLLRRTYLPAKGTPTGHLDVIHGWSDHPGRYGPLLEALRPLNMAICLPELRGHGHSGGQRGHINRFEEYLLDLTQLLGLGAIGESDPTPHWLLGHSMGGLVAFHLVLRFPRHYRGVVLSSPFMGPLPAMGSYHRLLVKLLSRLIPRLSLRKRIDSVGLSHDPGIAAAYDEDPLVHSRLTLRWLREILVAQEAARRLASTLSLPLLLLLPPDDMVVDAQASLAVYLRLPPGGKTLRVYPRRCHELHNESAAKAEKPLNDLVSWLYERQAKALV